MAPPEVEWRRAAAYAVCRDENGRLLLTRFAAPGHPDHGRWTLPGGALEWGETPEAAATREVEEESGLLVTLGPVLGVFSRWYTAQESARGEAGHVVGVVYEATAWTGELRTAWEPGSTDAAAWIDPAEIGGGEIGGGVAVVELVEYVLGLL